MRLAVRVEMVIRKPGQKSNSMNPGMVGRLIWMRRGTGAALPQSELVRKGVLEKVNVVRGDLIDRDIIERALGEYEVQTVFHLAAQTIVGIANRNPVSTFESNIEGTWNLLEACCRSPMVSAIVIASSDKAYGTHDVLPYGEEMALQGRHPYDVSKSCADLIAQAYAATNTCPSASLVVEIFMVVAISTGTASCRARFVRS